jgi:uncharacterized membrane protein YfcA
VRRIPLPLVAIGLIAGLFSALFGVGGGLIVVPLLLMWQKFPLRGATATSLGAVAITALVGVITYSLHGKVEVVPALLLGLPAAAGAYYGAGLQQRVPVRTLSILFALLLLAIAGKLFV